MNGQKREDEEKALSILKQYMKGSYYSKLECKDKPDLQDPQQNLGVEVTVACYEQEKEVAAVTHKRILHQSNLSKKDIDDKTFDKIYQKNRCEKLCFDSENQGEIYGYSREVKVKESLGVLLNAIETKLEHLNSLYTICKFNELFVFDQTDCLGENDFHRRVKHILEKITNDMRKKYECFFDKIYICRNKILDCIDLNTKTIEPYPLDESNKS